MAVSRGVRRSERLQVFDQIGLFTLGQRELQEIVVVIDDLAQRRKPAVMIEVTTRWTTSRQ